MTGLAAHSLRFPQSVYRMVTLSAADLNTAANSIRILAVDAVAQAKSGHQGMPMGMAEIAVALWRTNAPNGPHLRHNPDRKSVV